MKQVLLLTICFSFLAAQRSYSQWEQKIDSLKSLLETAPADTGRLRIYSQLCQNHQAAGNYEGQVRYAMEMKALAEELLPKSKGKVLLKVKIQLGNAYLSLGKGNRGLSNFDTAMVYALQAKKVYESIDSPVFVAGALELMGNLSTDRGNLKESIEYAGEAIAIYKKAGKKKKMGRMLVNQGASYIKMGNYTEAVKCELDAIRILEEVDDKDWIATGYLNLVAISRLRGNVEEALGYLDKADAITKETGDKFNQAKVAMSRGALYSSINEYEKSIESFGQSLKLNEEMGNKAEIIRAKVNIASIYNMQKKFSQALDILLQAMKPAEEIGGKEMIAYINYAIASNYVELNRIDEAIPHFEIAIRLAQEMQSKKWLLDYYKSFSEAFRRINDFENAYKYHVLYSEMNDSVYNETMSEQIEEMKAKFESEKKDAAIVLLNKDKEIQFHEIRRQKWIKNGSFAAFALASILFFLIYRTYQARQLLKLLALRNKIASDLHDDVGSTLSSIAIFSEIAQQQTSEVRPMLEQIGDSSRKMLDAMADIVWTINPENDQFEKIILHVRSFAYELLRAKKIDFEFDADETVSKLKLPMEVRKNLYLIFKEATNNIVKYAEAKKASFKISKTKDKLMMIIRDNGKGFDTAKEFLGNGLKNMKRRAQEIKAQLLIESEPDTGTTIQILLNL